MMFLKLLVAGHLTLFLTRHTGWMWQKPYPDLRLFLSLEGTQILGTLFAVYGWFIHPIGWAKAGIVWGYAIIWLLIMNLIKVLTVKFLNSKYQGQ
jgi:H+-transporting ATPase